MNRLGETLFALAKAKKAFRFVGGDHVSYYVMGGPYSGRWYYRKGTKRVYYSLPALIDTDVELKGGRKVNLPLPAECYVNPRRFHEDHMADRKVLAWKVVDWKRFRDQVYLPVLNRGLDILSYMDMNVKYDPLITTVLTCLCIVPNEIETQLHRASVPLRHKLNWLCVNLELLHEIGKRKRERFLTNVLRHGPKVALRSSFPFANSRTINSLMDTKITDYDVHLARILSSKQWSYPLPIDSLIKFMNLATGYPKRKDFFLTLASKYGREGLNMYTEFVGEQERARALYLHCDYPVDVIQPPNIYRAWHDEIVRMIEEFYKKSEEDRHKEAVEIRKKLWANYECPEGITPLIELADFINESERMKHCIRSYFSDRNHLYAHVEHNKEVASLEFGPEEGNIVQLKGICNADPSHALQVFVRRFIQSNMLE